MRGIRGLDVKIFNILCARLPDCGVGLGVLGLLLY